MRPLTAGPSGRPTKTITRPESRESVVFIKSKVAPHMRSSSG